MCCEYLLPAVTRVPPGSTDILVVEPCKNMEHGLQLVVMDAQLDRVPEDIPVAILYISLWSTCPLWQKEHTPRS